MKIRGAKTFSRSLRLWSCVGLLGFFIQVAAAQPVDYKPGVHYQELATPLPDVDADRIEVAELFWYGCPHCYDLLPTFQLWEASYRTTDMTFTRMPVIWNPAMEAHAHLYLAAEEAGLLPVVNKSSWQVTPTIHNAAFEALHEKNNPLLASADIAALFDEWGVDAAAYEQAWSSEKVVAKLDQLKKLPGLAEVPRLPALIVNGRYVITFNDAVTTSEELYKVLSFLVVKTRGTKRVEIR
ncbi:MAG: thiol:disulfide interchange protein DsbA/DsbL [Pseudomonadota bacterium]